MRWGEIDRVWAEIREEGKDGRRDRIRRREKGKTRKERRKKDRRKGWERLALTYCI
jgi:hypothetical protein